MSSTAHYTCSGAVVGCCSPFLPASVTSFWTLIWSGPETRIHSQGLAEDRQRAGWGTRLLYWKFPQRIRIPPPPKIKALGIALLILSSLPWLSLTQAESAEWVCAVAAAMSSSQHVATASGSPVVGTSVALTVAGGQLPQGRVHI